MNENIKSRIKNLCLIILILSITCLMISNMLPLFEINDNSFTGNSTKINMQSIEAFESYDLERLNNQMENINLISWGIIILTLISLFGMVVYSSKKYGKILEIFVYSGIPVVFLSGAAFILFVYLSLNTINSKTVLLTYIFDPFRYSYLPTVLFFFILIFSGTLFVLLVKFLLFNLRKRKKSEKEKKQKPKEKEDNEKDKKTSDLKLVLSDTEEKQSSISEKQKEKDLLEKKGKEDANLDTKTKEEKLEDIEPEIKEKENKKEESEKPKEKIPDKEDDSKKEDEKKDIFEEKKEEKTEEIIEEQVPEKTLESALDNAIKKRRTGEHTETKKDQEKEEKKTEKYQIKCPKCDHIFSIDKVEGENKIKCPKCGKEGIVKL